MRTKRVSVEKHGKIRNFFVTYDIILQERECVTFEWRPSLRRWLSCWMYYRVDIDRHYRGAYCIRYGVSIYQTTWWFIPKSSHLHSRWRENLKCRLHFVLEWMYIFLLTVVRNADRNSEANYLSRFRHLLRDGTSLVTVTYLRKYASSICSTLFVRHISRCGAYYRRYKTVPQRPVPLWCR